ncbi:calmin isoform X2 [Anguilla rostrata]|uniref:calmin isoform X2 n=1 Tax=Anguilla rostrata TaxID=7938 RepID=UPI0030CEADA7
MAGHEWDDWFEREEFIGQISDIRVQNLQVEREVVQKRTFTRWMNLHLEKCNPPLEVHDLFRDIQDGRILMALLEELSGSKLLHGFKPSSHRIFRLNNIAKVLAFLEERNVKLVSIDAADVADGNSSIVLGLIWNIILFFQIKELTGNIRSQFPSTSSLSSLPNSSDSDTSHSSTPSVERHPSIAMRDHGRPIKTLLQWVQRRTRKYGVAVQDFGKSWTSGLAFLAVIKSIDSSLVDMRRALLRSSRENLEDAFRTAHYSLGIPRLLEPEDVTINAPDEQSIMTYVSQFLEHFPGFDEEEMYIEAQKSKLTRQFSAPVNDSPVNGVQRKPYVVRKDWVQPPPKIFISSVSEDKEQPSSPLLTPGLEDSSDSVFTSEGEPQKRPQDLGKEVSFTVSSSSSPQLSFVDSINSPDSLLVESQSDGSLNENELPYDQKDWSPEKPSDGEQESQAENGNPTEDQVFTDLFIDEGNFSESSEENFQTKSKIPSEEEDAYQYIMGLNDEETAEPLSPGNGDSPEQTANRLGSVSEQMEETSVAQNKEDVLHKVDEHTTLSQNSIREPSQEHSGPEADDSLSKDGDRLEGALECEDTPTSQNHVDDKQSSPDFSPEMNKMLRDAICEEQEDSTGLKTEDHFKQTPPEICVEPPEFEEQDHTEIPSNSMYSGDAELTDTTNQNPIEDKDPSGLEKTQTQETPTLDSDQLSEMIVSSPDISPTVEADVNILESNELCGMTSGAPCEGSPTEENSGAPDKLDETNDDRKNDNTSCAPGDNERSDRGGREPDVRDETEGVEHDIIAPEVIETLAVPPLETPAEECSSHSTTDPQHSPIESEGPTEECTEDHAYLSWMAGPDSGDDLNDAAEDADEKSSYTGPESEPVGLHGTDSVLELEDSLAENTEDSNQEEGRQEGPDASSQMLCSNERQGNNVGDSGGTELDMASELCELIKTDEDPVVASNNTETLRGKVENEVSTSESQSDGLKVKGKEINESGRSHKINSDLRRECKSPVACGVTAAELYWLLFLWIALYCFFVLPQMDMKTLPHLLLNLDE